MPLPNRFEQDALSRCEKLLKFATENKTGLPKDVAAGVEAAWEAKRVSKWSKEIGTNFISAYDTLCSHIKPATPHTIEMATPVLSFPKFFWKGRNSSVPRKWAHAFLSLLLIVLGVSMFAAFVTTQGEIIATTEVPRLMAGGDTAVERIRALLSEQHPRVDEAKPFTDQRLSKEDNEWVSELQKNVVTLFVIADTLYEKSNSVAYKILFLNSYSLCQEGQFPAANGCYHKGWIEHPRSVSEIRREMSNAFNFFETQRAVRVRTDAVITGLAAMKAYILPALLGMLGACTSVVRTVSDEIKCFTFSRSSPLRHMVRVALGMIVGVVVVTFYDAPSATKLSASFWAFLAGYAMDSVFAVFDSLVARLK